MNQKQVAGPGGRAGVHVILLAPDLARPAHADPMPLCEAPSACGAWRPSLNTTGSVAYWLFGRRRERPTRRRARAPAWALVRVSGPDALAELAEHGAFALDGEGLGAGSGSTSAR